MCQASSWILHVLWSQTTTFIFRGRDWGSERINDLPRTTQVVDVESRFQPRPPDSLVFPSISSVLGHILSWSLAPVTNYLPIIESSMLARVSLPIREDTVAPPHPEWLEGTQENPQGASRSLKVNPECKLWILAPESIKQLHISRDTCVGHRDVFNCLWYPLSIASLFLANTFLN